MFFHSETFIEWWGLIIRHCLRQGTYQVGRRGNEGTQGPSSGSWQQTAPMKGGDTQSFTVGVGAQPHAVHYSLVYQPDWQALLQAAQPVGAAHHPEGLQHTAVVSLVGSSCTQFPLKLQTGLDHLQGIGENTGGAASNGTHGKIQGRPDSSGRWWGTKDTTGYSGHCRWHPGGWLDTKHRFFLRRVQKPCTGHPRGVFVPLVPVVTPSGLLWICCTQWRAVNN